MMDMPESPLLDVFYLMSAAKIGIIFEPTKF